MGFDYKKALEDGASKQEIVEFVKSNKLENFDFDTAYERGANDDQIFDALVNKPMNFEKDVQMVQQAAPTATPVTTGDAPAGPVATAQDTFKPSAFEQPRADIVQPEDGTATAPVSMGFGLDGASTETPQYATEQEFEQIKEERLDKAQDVATSETFAQTVVDPKTGEKIQVEPSGLETDIPILTGKLAAIRLLSNPALQKTMARFAPMAAHGGVQLSREAAYIVNRNPELSDEAVQTLLKDVPKKDQAYVLSRASGPEGAGYINQAVAAGGDADRIALLNELKAPRNKLVEAVGDIDVDRAKHKYADMIEEVAGDYKNVFDATPMLENLNFLKTFYGATPSTGARVVNQMEAVLTQNPKITLSDALEFRADLNYLLNKATRGVEKRNIKAIKNNVDRFIDSVATTEQKALIDDAINTYSRTMQNRELVDIIAKNSKSGDTILDDGLAVIENPNAIATDWVKVKRDLADAGLTSPEYRMAVDVVEQYAKRFAADPALATAARVRGSTPEAGGVLGAWSYGVSVIKDFFAIYGNRAENVRIQKSILHSLRKSNTNKEFIDNLIASKQIPEDAKDTIVKAFSREAEEAFPDLPTAKEQQPRK